MPAVMTKRLLPLREPKVRADGLCYVCRKPRPVVAERNLDPFCSAPCCRKYYEVKEGT